MTPNTATLSLTIHSLITLSITMHSIIILSIKTLFVAEFIITTLSIQHSGIRQNDSQLNNTQHIDTGHN